MMAERTYQRSGAPEIERVFESKSKKPPGKYCAVCLRSDNERRLVDNATFKKFILAVNLEHNWMPLQEPSICFICDRQAVNAFKFFRATRFACSINKIFMEIMTRDKSMRKQIFNKTHFKRMMLQINLDDEKTLPSQWETELKIIQRRSLLQETRTLVIDSLGVKIGDMDNIVNLDQGTYTTTVLSAPVQLPREITVEKINNAQAKRPIHEAIKKIKNLQNEPSTSSNRVEDLVHELDEPEIQLRSFNPNMSDYVITVEEDERDPLKVETISDTEDTDSNGECLESSLTSNNPQRGLVALNNPQRGLVATNNPQQRVIASNNPQQGLVASNNPQLRVIASNNPQQRVIASNNPQQRVIASNNPQQRVIASNNPQQRVIASNNPQRGLVASNNPQKGLNASNNSQRSLVPSNNPQQRVIASNNPQKGLNASKNSQQGLIASNNHQRSLVPSNNTQQGLVSSNNPQLGLISSNNPQQNFVTSNNPQLGLITSNAQQGLITSNNPQQGLIATNAQQGLITSNNIQQGLITSNGPQLGLITSNAPQQGLVASNNLQFGLITTNAPPQSIITSNAQQGLITSNNIQQGIITSNAQQGLITSNNPPQCLISSNAQQGLITSNAQQGLITSNNIQQGLITSNNPQQGLITSTNPPQIQAPKLVPIEKLLQPVEPPQPETQYILHPLVFNEAGALTVQTITAHVIDGQLYANNVVLQNGQLQQIFPTVLPAQTEVNAQKRKSDEMVTQIQGNIVDMAKRKVLPVNAKPAENKTIDWEDKIPMDVISFMDAVDPRSVKRHYYRALPNGELMPSSTNTTTSTITNIQDVSNAEVIDLC